MKEFAFNLWNLFNHNSRPVYMLDGQPITYALDGKWQVRQIDTQALLFETDSAVDMSAWLNSRQVRLTP